ncbi:MAG: carboxypeptidase [Rhodoglobus sp.]|nr:carboxypeptidase [Rhodoglobus sp.]
MSPSTVARLRDAMRQADDITHLLAELVAIDTPTGDRGGLDAALEVVGRELAGRGFAIQHDSGDDGLPVLIADRGVGQPFGLVGHLDTVFGPGEAARRPFAVEGDRATGPGVADMKGGIVTILRCIDFLDLLGSPPALRIIINGDEERGSAGSRRVLVERLRSARAALVFEPGRPGGEFVSSRRGTVRFRIRVAGIAAHSGVAPRDGANAVHDLAGRIVRVAALAEDLPGCDVNVNLIAGGVGINTVPDHAEAEVDVRTSSLADDDRIRRSVEQIAEEPGVPRTTCSIEWLASRRPLERHPRQDALIALFTEAGADLGFPVSFIGTGGGSDGNLLGAEGITVIDGCGPVGDGYHRVDEFVRVSTILERAAICAAALQRAAERSPHA